MNNFLDLCRHIGETVTIFTTSGGASGCGFTGVLIDVNPTYCRLLTRMGTPPANPLAENICGEFDNGPGRGRKGCGMEDTYDHSVGSVCDIPICKIASFCHNAI
ncbi:MAG: putative rane protein [Herbinix sp.]|nr:putative rane protein [Herbinix sp.]